MGATITGAGIIWSVNYNYLGPHEWDVRANLATPRLSKVSTDNYN